MIPNRPCHAHQIIVPANLSLDLEAKVRTLIDWMDFAAVMARKDSRDYRLELAKEGHILANGQPIR